MTTLWPAEGHMTVDNEDRRYWLRDSPTLSLGGEYVWWYREGFWWYREPLCFEPIEDEL
jgi:hypothetical protein